MGYKNWDVAQFNIKHFHSNSSENSQKVILMFTLLIG